MSRRKTEAARMAAEMRAVERRRVPLIRLGLAVVAAAGAASAIASLSAM